jgi:uncharacterized membrane protein
MEELPVAYLLVAFLILCLTPEVVYQLTMMKTFGSLPAAAVWVGIGVLFAVTAWLLLTGLNQLGVSLLCT